MAESTHDHLFKLLIIGDSGVGKSSILLRFCPSANTFRSAAARLLSNGNTSSLLALWVSALASSGYKALWNADRQGVCLYLSRVPAVVDAGLGLLSGIRRKSWSASLGLPDLPAAFGSQPSSFCGACLGRARPKTRRSFWRSYYLVLCGSRPMCSFTTIWFYRDQGLCAASQLFGFMGIKAYVQLRNNLVLWGSRPMCSFTTIWFLWGSRPMCSFTTMLVEPKV